MPTDQEIIIELQNRVETLEAERAAVVDVLGNVDPFHPETALADARAALGLTP